MAPHKKAPTIWVIADDRPGNANQAIGIAEASNLPFIQKNIHYTKHSSLHNAIKGKSLLGIDIAKSDSLTAPWPDIVIAAGRRTAPIARYIKKQSNNKTFITQIMWPGFPYHDVDLIATPTHDNITLNHRIIQTIGAPHRVTQSRLKEEKKKWEKQFTELPKSKIAILVGGTAGKHIFTTEHASQLAEYINTLAKKNNAGILITTSRRTSDEATKILKNTIQEPRIFHQWGDQGDNPFFGFLACSDTIIVTGESMSMCSESCASGKPVYIFAPPSLITSKHALLHQALYEQNYAQPLDSANSTATKITWNKNPLNESKHVAEQILEKFFQQ